MEMSREEYKQRAAEIYEYFAPGKKVTMAGVTVTMMSVVGGQPSQVAPITHDQLPIIQCIYSTYFGTLNKISIEWADLEALRDMNNQPPLEKPPTTEYVDRG